MRRPQTRLLTVTAIAALTALLGACAQPAPESTTAPDRPRSTPAATASPSPAPSAVPTGAVSATPGAPGTATPPEAQPELVDFETQNGTMRLRIPADWIVQDSSRIAMFPEERGQSQRWSNEVSIGDVAGGTLGYFDHVRGDTGVGDVETHVVEQIPVGGGLAATAWWRGSGDGTFSAGVGVVEVGREASHWFRVGDGERLHSLQYFNPVGAGFASSDAAEDYLAGEDVALVLDVLRTVEFDGHEDALPAGVGVEHEGTTYLPYTTRNGTSTFLVPVDWRIDDTSHAGYGHGGVQVWENWVGLFRPNGGSAALYVDYVLFQGAEPEWDWIAGEVRPTTDGLHAVSYMLGDTGDFNTGLVGVNLSDQGDASRPTGTVCAETICRVFTSTQLGEGEDFFGGPTEEQLLTVIASLERHHDDARMP